MKLSAFLGVLLLPCMFISCGEAPQENPANTTTKEVPATTGEATAEPAQAGPALSIEALFHLLPEEQRLLPTSALDSLLTHKKYIYPGSTPEYTDMIEVAERTENDIRTHFSSNYNSGFYV